MRGSYNGWVSGTRLAAATRHVFSPASRARPYPFGPHLLAEGHVSLRVWAPRRQCVIAVIDGTPVDLDRGADGVFEGVAPAHAGSRYGFRLDDGEDVLPDPISPFQPDGVDGLSEVIAHDRFSWTDQQWRGRAQDDHVIYELHCGTFTSEGTWHAAQRELEQLAGLGVTTVQVMPVNTCAGAYGWGYDGVFWYAPNHLYGRPDDFRAFVDRAHGLGLSVLLDVVYNHTGPRGSVMKAFSDQFFTDRYPNEWGRSINFDGEGASAVRQLVCANAAYWVREFHVDGLRLDATQQMNDASPRHVIGELAAAARAAAPARSILLVAENEPQDAIMLRAPEAGGHGLDMVYNDDFHHTARVRLTGWREAYYADYSGSAAELLSCALHGFLYQGQYYPWQAKHRGTPVLGVQPHRFLCFLENHDQVANSDVLGRRLHALAAPGLLRACTALLLLGPWTPLLFQGQEHGASEPWVFFADHPGEIGAMVRTGRAEFVGQFSRLRHIGPDDHRPDPLGRDTFERCRLRRSDGDTDRPIWRLHHDLLALRRDLRGDDRDVHGMTPDADLLVIRYVRTRGDWLLVINLGTDRDIAALATPLVAPPAAAQWTLAWSSEDLRYGGTGQPRQQPDRWLIAGYSAAVFTAGTGDTNGDEASHE